LLTCFQNAISTMEKAFPEGRELADGLRQVIAYSDKNVENGREVMEKLRCVTAQECLSGAVYVCLTCPEDFDAAMILAVNHSGRSAAVASLAGAILGAKMGAEALPEFYLECLEPAPVLEELAADLALCSPTVGLFDDDWDHKYVQGLPKGVDG
jgi:ADP-ribosylglycohydrolase